MSTCAQHSIWFTVVLWIKAVLTVLGNCMVCAAFLTNKRLRTITNHFVFSLAIGDLLAGGLLLPMYILEVNSPETTIKISGFIFVTALTNIVGCTYDRFIAIHNPLRYNAILTKKRVYVLILFIWLVPSAITMLQLIWAKFPEEKRTMCQKYYVGVVFFGFLLTCIILFGIYVSIFRVARRHMAKIAYLKSFTDRHNGGEKSSLSSSSGSSGRRRFSMRSIVNEVKATKLFAIIGLTFALCWLPLIYINLVHDVFGRSELAPCELQYVSAFTVFANSLIDPIIYAFFQSSFRQTVKGWAVKLQSTLRKSTDKNQNCELRTVKPQKKISNAESASLCSDSDQRKEKVNGVHLNSILEAKMETCGTEPGTCTEENVNLMKQNTNDILL